MAPKSKAKPGTDPSALPTMCIRCPDAKSAQEKNHQNDFIKCSAAYPTTAPSGQTPAYTASNLWWGFTDGPNTLDLRDVATCTQLLDRAIGATSDKKLTGFRFETDAQENTRINSHIAAKQSITVDDKIITKGMLEAAVRGLADDKAQKAADKKAEKEKKKADREAQLATQATVQQAVTNVMQNLQQTSLSGGVAAQAAMAQGSGQATAATITPSASSSTGAHVPAAPQSAPASSSLHRTPLSSSTAQPIVQQQPATTTTSNSQQMPPATPANSQPPSTTNQPQPPQSQQPAATVAPTRPTTSHLTQSVVRLLPPKIAIDVRPVHNQQQARLDPRGNGFPVNPANLPDSNKLALIKRHAMRTEFATSQNPFDIYVNHFQITLPTGTTLYEYIVDSQSPEWRDATRNKRKVFIRDLIDTVPQLSNNVTLIASDYRTKIIAGQDLFNGQVTINAVVASYKRGTRDAPTNVALTLTLNRTFNMDELNNYVSGTNMNYEELGATEAMNIMVSKAVADGAVDTFMAGNNRFYYRPGWQDLGPNYTPDSKGLIAVRGYYCSVRPGMGAVTLNVNTVTSTFYRPQTVQQYLQNLGPFPDPAITQQSNPGQYHSRELQLRAANDHLAGLRSYVNFTRYLPGDPDHSIDTTARRIKVINDIAKRAQDVTFKRNPTDVNEISVWNHIRQKYPNVQRAPPDQLAVNVGSRPPNHKYYLAQNLDVLGDQIYRQKLPSHLVASMISVARRRPDQNRAAILHEGLTSLRLHQHPAPPMLNVLGITVSRDMLSVPARRADVPTVCYGAPQRGNNPVNPRVTPDDGFWMTRGQTFVDSAKGFRRPTGPNARPRVHFIRVNDNTAQFSGWQEEFRTNFVNLHSSNGLDRLQQYPQNNPWTTLQNNPADWNALNLSTLLVRLKNVDQIGLVVLMLPKEDALYAGRHAMFKSVCEQIVGIKSAVFCEVSMESSMRRRANEPVDVIGPRAMGAYMGNYAMKLNLRLGNTNHVLTPQGMPVVIRAGQQLDCMMLGADVTHPSGGSSTGTPSIAAVVGSIDGRFGMFPGSMRLQTPRNEMIEDMRGMTYQCLARWAENTKIGNVRRLPSRILLYRDGVSESQYSAVREHEVLRVREAWDDAWRHYFPSQAKPLGLPQITAVIVAKRHHTRFFPKGNDSTRSGNCRPGTIVDSSITSPYYMDFFLMSHNIQQGTAKPAHYFVLKNGMRFTADQLQDLTNNLCYTYGKSTTAVSYAPPAYYADRLCERGRHYLTPLFDGNPSFRQWTAAEVLQQAQDWWTRGPANSGNPWHPNMNDTMFWM
ncbi:hypothetical protein LTR85_001498 [Meristemomyces frigidus]|nr:hypothetical protein LTR85_001498 [Meristemomyces frigidus]